MSASTSIARFDLARLRPLADWLAIAVAVTLPWSTTAVGIAIAAWAVTVLLSLDAAAVKREICSPAGGLPVVLWCLGIVGMLWADVNWHDRFAGLSSFHRLLAIPLLLAQFRRFANGIWVVCAFFISSLGLLLASYFIVFALGDRWRGVGACRCTMRSIRDRSFLSAVSAPLAMLFWRAASGVGQLRSP